MFYCSNINVFDSRIPQHTLLWGKNIIEMHYYFLLLFYFTFLRFFSKSKNFWIPKHIWPKGVRIRDGGAFVLFGEAFPESYPLESALILCCLTISYQRHSREGGQEQRAREGGSKKRMRAGGRKGDLEEVCICYSSRESEFPWASQSVSSLPCWVWF